MNLISLASTVVKLDEIIRASEQNSTVDPSQHAKDTWAAHARNLQTVRDLIVQEIGTETSSSAADASRLRERVYWAESSLDTWDDERDASYWQRYPEPMPSPFSSSSVAKEKP